MNNVKKINADINCIISININNKSGSKPYQFKYTYEKFKDFPGGDINKIIKWSIKNNCFEGILKNRSISSIYNTLERMVDYGILCKVRKGIYMGTAKKF